MQTPNPSPVHELQSDAIVNPITGQLPRSQSPRSPDEATHKIQQRDQATATPQHPFIVGFYSALIIAVLCLAMGAVYLYKFMESSNSGIEKLLDTATSQTLKLSHPSEVNNSANQSVAAPKYNSDARPATETNNSSSNELKADAPSSSGTALMTTSQSLELKAMPVGLLEVLINGRLVMARLALLSCGVFVGFAFGFLGFALFLLGIKGSINAELGTEYYKASFARLSPGLLLLLASVILIGICVTHQTPFEYAVATTEEASSKSLPSLTPGEKATDNKETTNETLPPKVE